MAKGSRLTESDRSDHGPDQIKSRARADFRLGHMQALLQHASDSPGERHLEPVQNPRRAQPDHY